MTGVRESEIDGVLCFWVDMGRPASCAHLIFRQGLADEPLHESGWLHLLEHLALLDRETLTRPIEGRLSLLRTHFAAFGGPEAITQHVGDLARWLAEPDLRLLPRRAGPAAGPGPRVARPADPLADLAVRRVRAGRRQLCRDRRRARHRPPADRAVPPGVQRRQRDPGAGRPAARRVAGAAPGRRVLHRRRPPSPSAERCPPPTATRSVSPSAAWSPGPTRPGSCPSSSSARCTTGYDATAAAPTGSGPRWPTWTTSTRVVAGGSEVVDEMLPTLAKAALEVTGQLAENGVPREWVQEAVDRRLRVLESPAARVETALEAAYAALSDRVPMTYEELLTQLRETDPARVDRAAQELHASLLVGLPEAAPLHRSIPAADVPRVAAPGHRRQAQPRQLARRHDHLLGRRAGRRAADRQHVPIHAARRRRRPAGLARRRPPPDRPRRQRPGDGAARVDARQGPDQGARRRDPGRPAPRDARPGGDLPADEPDRARRLGLRARGQHPGRPVLAAGRGDAAGAVGDHRRPPGPRGRPPGPGWGARRPAVAHRGRAGTDGLGAPPPTAT